MSAFEAIQASLSELESSRYDVTPTSNIAKIPLEILLHVISFLDISDVLTLRKTSLYLCEVSHDKALWQSLLRAQSQQLPLASHHVAYLYRKLSDSGAREIEHVVLSADRIDRNWLLPRPSLISPYLCMKSSDLESCLSGLSSDFRSMSAMDIFLDRWLVCIYCDGMVELWDIQTDALTQRFGKTASTQSPEYTPKLWFRKPLSRVCLSSTLNLDQDQESVILMVVFHSQCSFWRVHLPISCDDARLENIATITLTTPAGIARALYPPLKLAMLSLSDTLYLIDWEKHQQCRIEAPPQTDEEELWNGIIGARFLTSEHILCVKVRTVELWAITSVDCSCANTATGRGGPQSSAPLTHAHAHIVTHTFPGTTFRGVSFSAPTITTYPSLNEEIAPAQCASISFLTYDVLRGLFHYLAKVYIASPSSSEPAPLPQMSVRLLAVHHMALLISRADPGDTRPVPRSQMTPGSRAFVSACVLGTMGRRGVWVERRRGSIGRSVVGFKAASTQSKNAEFDDEDDTLVGESEVPRGVDEGALQDSETEQNGHEEHWWETATRNRIDGCTIFEVKSYDLRDDVTHCALSEATGGVVLCTRNGELQIL